MAYQIFKVGDRVMVDTEYNGSRVVEITEVLEDVSFECGLDPSPGFVGIAEVIPGHFEEMVYADSQFVEFVDPTEDDLRGGYLPTDGHSPGRVTRSDG